MVWCKSCGHRVEPDVAAAIERYSEGLTVIEWARRLRCSKCGAREADFVVSGAAR
jgi:DNA-directed RNA polymerase subunit RPC12/RpoP